MDLGPPWARPVRGPATTVAALLLVAACSWSPAGVPAGVPAGEAEEPVRSAAVLVGGEAPDPDRPRDLGGHGGSGGSGAAPRVELLSRVTRIAGHLTDVRRERVGRQARGTVADYLEGAFAADRAGPFSRFQAGLRRAARSDREVLSAKAPRAVTRAAAWFSVAAPAGRPVGVTARLWVDLSDGSGPGATLTGRLLLTRQAGEWQVFGYDLARSGAARSEGGR